MIEVKRSSREGVEDADVYGNAVGESSVDGIDGVMEGVAEA